jgi:mycothiol synthase
MTDTAPIPTPRRIEALDAPTPQATEAVLALIDAAAEEDGRPAVSEQGRLNLRGGARFGVRHFLMYAADEAQRGNDDILVGYSQLEDTDPVEAPAAELVVHPAHRAKGHGRALGHTLLAASGKRLRVWAHGGHPAGRHLAGLLGLALFRELRQMRRPLDAGPGYRSRYSPRASRCAPSCRARMTRPGWRPTRRRSPTTRSRAG